MHVCACMFMCVCVYVCACMHSCVREFMHACAFYLQVVDELVGHHECRPWPPVPIKDTEVDPPQTGHCHLQHQQHTMHQQPPTLTAGKATTTSNTSTSNTNNTPCTNSPPL